MKKIYKSHLATLCGVIGVAASALLSPSDVNASDQMCVGYVNPSETVYPYTGFTNDSQEGGTLYFVVRVEASKFASYEGASMTGIRVGWSMGSEELKPDMEVFVRESLDGGNLASGTEALHFGWNDISFDTPYTIPADKDIYIGGKVEWEPGSWLGTGTLGVTLPEGSQFMGNSADVDADGNINWIDVSDTSNGAILILGLVEADGDQFKDKGLLEGFNANEVQSLAYPGDAWLIVKNNGVNEMQSAEVTASLGDKTWSYTYQFSKPIEGGQQSQVTGGIQALGTGVHEIWISKVNGKEVEKVAPVEFNFIAVPEAVGEKYTRRPLVERWISESNHLIPTYTDDIFIPGVRNRKGELSVISHHVADQFMIYHEFETDVDCEGLKLLLDLANGERNRVMIPSFAVDRSYIPRNPIAKCNDKSVAYSFIYPDFVGGLYDAALDVPTFASLSASCEAADEKCTVEVSGHIESGIMPEGEKLNLTVYLVEDNVKSTSQEFPDDPEVTARYNGVFTHQDLIRANLTGLYGDVVENDGDFSMKFDCELDPEWDLENVRVLAFLNRSGEKHSHMQVINSCESKMGYSGVEGIQAADNMFSVEGRDIVAAPGNTLEVYTVGGVHVSAGNLCPGIYIVKCTGSEGTIARKVAIK